MKLSQYLERKYGGAIVGMTKIEARQFGVPYPLISGWERHHANLVITPQMAACVIEAFKNPSANAGKDKHRQRAIDILGALVEPSYGIDAYVKEQDKHMRDLTVEVRTMLIAKSRSGQVPEGDVRLTANVRRDLHLRLKIAAATQRTTIGALIEKFVETML